VFYQPTIGDREAEVSALIFNADGSRAEMSGNGVRCLAAWLCRSGQNPSGTVRVRTVSGVKVLVAQRHDAKIVTFESSMGHPITEPERIPMRSGPPSGPVLDWQLTIGQQTVPVTATSMGNPHCSTFWPDVDSAPIDILGPLLERHACFPNRTNVEFVQVLDPHRLRVRFWERGVGRTLSSGTGSSAAAVAAILTGRVESPGRDGPGFPARALESAGRTLPRRTCGVHLQRQLCRRGRINGTGMSASAPLLEFFQHRGEESLQLLRRLVELESYSLDKPAIDGLADFMAGRFRALGAEALVLPVGGRGNLLRAVWAGSGALKPVMLLGHLDTVWPAGTLAERPFRVENLRAFGPGVFDMKAGLLLSLLVCEALAAGHVEPGREVVFFFTSDEEIGTEAGVSFLLPEAARCGAVLCLEPPLPGGKAKTFRKATGSFRLKVTGVAAHAGVDHEKGANAITEISRQVLKLHGFTDYDRGITVSVGRIAGGTSANVVPAEADAEIDFRAASLEDGLRVEREIRSLAPIDRRCRLEFEGGINRPPLARSDRVVALFRLARRVASEFGMTLEEGSTGGGSDGCFTAAMGVPTLDGIGVEGDGAHAVNEHILVGDIARRAAFIASLIKSIGE
jgi:glutamate carboxypeptidase